MISRELLMRWWRELEKKAWDEDVGNDTILAWEIRGKFFFESTLVNEGKWTLKD